MCVHKRSVSDNLHPSTEGHKTMGDERRQHDEMMQDGVEKRHGQQ